MTLHIKAGVLRRNTRRSLSALAMLFGFAVASCFPGVPLNAQLFGPRAAPKADDDGEKTAGLNSERRVNKQLEEFSAEGKKKKLADVLEILDSLRSADPLLMVPDPRGTFIPLHRDLVQRLQALDSEMRKSIEDASGQVPTQIERGVQTGPESLLKAMHQNAGTRQGWIAHLMLATIHYDRGNTLAAQYWLRPLLTPAVPDDVRIAAEKLSDRILTSLQNPTQEPEDRPTTNQANAQLDEKSTTVPEKAPAPAPEQSVTEDASGNSTEAKPDSGEARSESSTEQREGNKSNDDFKANGEVVPSLFVHWMQQIPISEKERRVSQDLVRRARERAMIPWCAWEPLADDQFVFVRTPYLIKAFDRLSGNHIWTKVIQRRPASTDESLPPGFPMPQLDEDDPDSNIENSVEVQTLHRNEIVGRMSADSDRLYAVVQIVDGVANTSQNMMRMRINLDMAPGNMAGLWELVALEKSTGRRIWTAGGMPIEERFGNDLSGSWFAGPPVVRGHELLSVVERKGAIELVGLAANTGQLRWTTLLAYPDGEINTDFPRQLLSAHVAVESGVIFTTTTSGWLFAVDALSHSVLWARKLPVATPAVSQQQRFQMRALGQGAPKPLPAMASVWRSETPMVTGNAVVVNSAECSQMIVIEPLTGRILHRNSADKSTLLLYGDESTVVISSPNTIQALSVPNLRKIWSNPIENKEVIPVGRAARQKDLLLIPMSDGGIAVHSFETGKLITTLRDLRPPRSAGGLYPVAHEPLGNMKDSASTEPTDVNPPTNELPSSSEISMLSFAPDHVGVLSLSPPELVPSQDAFQRANFLAETGQFAKAREAIDSVQVHALNADPVRQLRFRIAIGELVSSDLKSGSADDGKVTASIESIMSLARSPRELAIAQMLRIKSISDAKSPRLFEELIRTLSSDESLLTVEVVPPDRLYSVLRNSSTDPLERSSVESIDESLRMPFRSWTIQQIRNILSAGDDAQRSSLIRSMTSLSDEDVLQMHSPALVNEYLRRADRDLQDSKFRESTIHLIVAALSLLPDDKSKSAESVQQAGELMKRIRSLAENGEDRESSQAILVRRLLEVLHHELLVGKLEEEPAAPADLTQTVRDRWLSFPELTYSMQPVQTSGTQAYRQVNLRHVETSASHDPFLSAFDWSIRRDPGALLARSVADPDRPQWSLNTTADENAVIYSDEEIHRVGSVVLLQNSTSVSAFSSIDHRWLWTRPFGGPSSRRTSIIERRPFGNFRTLFQSNNLVPIAGSSYRWICLQSKSTIEVVDMLNGRRLWSMTKATDGLGNIVACEGFLSIRSTRSAMNEQTMNLNPLDGSTIHQETGEMELNERFLTTTPDSIVVGESGFAGRRGTGLRWIRPGTRDVIRTMDLNDMKTGQFLDPNTLIVVTDNETFHVINLQDGTQKTFSFASSREDLDDMDPSSVRVSCDAANYYVFEVSDDGPMRILGMTYGLEAEPIGEQLRVISRVTGDVVWEDTFEEGTMACIRSNLSPVLLLLQNRSDLPNNGMILPGLGQGFQKWNIRGISRVSGKSLLDFSASVRTINTHLQLDVLEGGVLDLEAFGNRVRFRPQTVVAP